MLLCYSVEKSKNRGDFMERTEEKKIAFDIREIVLIGLFTALTAVGAFIKIPIPYISFSLQTLFVAMAGMLLGARNGMISMAVYVIIGLLGFPIFTQGGGIGYVLQPSFGYLIGFLVYAYMTGYFTRKLKEITFKNLFLAQLPGMFVMYAIALPYFFFISQYYTENPIGVGALFTYCFALLLPGEALKCSIAAGLGKRLIPVLKKGGMYK